MRRLDPEMTHRSVAPPWCVLALLAAACSSSTVVTASSAKDITAFSIGAAAGTISGTSIAVTVPFGTDLTSLAPTITVTGASVSPASGVAENFTNPVTYTVTAADGSTQEYRVTVTVEPLGIRSFVLRAADNPVLTTDVVGFVGATHVAVALPNTFALPASFTPTIALNSGASVNPASAVAQQFTATSNVDVSNPVTYTVTAADGVTTKPYAVTVNKTNKNIILFTINGVDGTIVTGGGGGGGGGSGTVTLVLQTGTDLHALAPFIGFTGKSVSPASGVARDFSAGSVTYTVTGADDTTKPFTVTVTAP